MNIKSYLLELTGEFYKEFGLELFIEAFGIGQVAGEPSFVVRVVDKATGEEALGYAPLSSMDYIREAVNEACLLLVVTLAATAA